MTDWKSRLTILQEDITALDDVDVAYLDGTFWSAEELPGRDLGMVFLAGEYLGTYARVPQTNAWNTTIHSGGRYAAHEPPPEIVELAERAQAPFGMDFTTVDVAETAQGPIVFETHQIFHMISHRFGFIKVAVMCIKSNSLYYIY